MSGQHRYVARQQHELQQSCQVAIDEKPEPEAKLDASRRTRIQVERVEWQIIQQACIQLVGGRGTDRRCRCRRYLHMLTVGASCQLPFRWIVLQSGLGHKLMFLLSGDSTVGIMLTIRGNFLGIFFGT